jgi:hypothetical protein
MISHCSVSRPLGEPFTVHGCGIRVVFTYIRRTRYVIHRTSVYDVCDSNVEYNVVFAVEYSSDRGKRTLTGVPLAPTPYAHK